MQVLSATAPHVLIERVQATSRIVLDENTGARIGWIDIVRGFAHYTGIKGSAHEGFACVIALGGGGSLEPLVASLAEGVRNGRDDRR